jgi:plasmid stabilization system protein ParE
MSYSDRFTEAADADFDDILHFIAADNPHRAISFVEELSARIFNVLNGFPGTGKR